MTNFDSYMHNMPVNQILKVVFQAYEICIKRDLLREQVFILGRMGNSKQALAVIINKLGDIEEVHYFFQLNWSSVWAVSFANLYVFSFKREEAG